MKSLILGILALLSLSVSAKGQAPAAAPETRALAVHELRILTDGFKVKLSEDHTTVTLHGKIPKSCGIHFEVYNTNRHHEIANGSNAAGFSVMDMPHEGKTGAQCIADWRKANPGKCSAKPDECSDLSEYAEGSMNMQSGERGEYPNYTEIKIFHGSVGDSLNGPLHYYNSVARAQMARMRAEKARADLAQHHRNIVDRCRKTMNQIEKFALKSLEFLEKNDLISDEDSEDERESLADAAFKATRKEVVKACKPSKMKDDIDKCKAWGRRLVQVVETYDAKDLTSQAVRLIYGMYNNMKKSKEYNDDPERVGERIVAFLEDMLSDLGVTGSNALIRAAQADVDRKVAEKNDEEMLEGLRGDATQVVFANDPFWNMQVNQARWDLDARYRSAGCGLIANTNPSYLNGGLQNPSLNPQLQMPRQQSLLPSGLGANSGICQQIISTARQVEQIDRQGQNYGRASMMEMTSGSGFFGASNGNPFL